MAKFYSIQPRRIWKKYLKLGYMEGSKENAMYPEQYKWMVKQMTKRLPNYKGEYPIWLWVDFPVMYRFTNSIVSRKKFVLLTIELNHEDVLLSDFDAWHIPLNDGVFNEDTNLLSSYKYNENEDMSDWENIFNFDWLKENFYENNDEILTLQGTTGRIPIDKVVDIKYFTTKKWLL